MIAHRSTQAPFRQVDPGLHGCWQYFKQMSIRASRSTGFEIWTAASRQALRSVCSSWVWAAAAWAIEKTAITKMRNLQATMLMRRLEFGKYNHQHHIGFYTVPLMNQLTSFRIELIFVETVPMRCKRALHAMSCMAAMRNWHFFYPHALLKQDHLQRREAIN